MMPNRAISHSRLQRCWGQRRGSHVGAARRLVALALLALGSWSWPVRAQSCPGGYSSCDNGGCCLNSDQCCPLLEEGCCAASTPFCCGDGTCAASPSECANAGRNTCTGYDIPCGKGCAPAGSHCCDPSAGYYCPPQGICTSEIKCRAGDVESVAKLVASTAALPSASTPERNASPLLDPADGTERSCALAAAAPSAAVPASAVSFALILAAAWARRRRP
jgi:hypothetical protein